MNTNSVNLASELELKANNLRFNKYGFIQPENSTNTLSNNNHKNNKSSNQLNGGNSLQSLNTNKSTSINGEPNFNNNNNRESG